LHFGFGLPAYKLADALMVTGALLVFKVLCQRRKAPARLVIGQLAELRRQRVLVHFL